MIALAELKGGAPFPRRRLSGACARPPAARPPARVDQGSFTT